MVQNDYIHFHVKNKNIKDMSAAKLEQQNFTIEEYLAFEAKSAIKHEYENGQVFAMSGGTPNHAFIGGSTVAALRNALKAKGSKCRVSGSELKVHIEKYNSFVYPDGMLVLDFGRKK